MDKHKQISDNGKQTDQSGFVTMIVIMLVILGAVIYLAYKRVSQH